MMLLFDRLLMVAAAAFVASLITGSQGDVQVQTGLCGGDSDSCTELDEGEICRSLMLSDSPRLRADWITTCDELINQDVPTYASSALPGSHCSDLVNGAWTGDLCLPNLDVRCGQNCDSSESVPPKESWPVLNYTFMGVSNTHFLVDLNWTLPRGVSVPGYMLVIGNSSSWDRCSNYDPHLCGFCVIYLSNTTLNYRHQSNVLRFRPGRTKPPTLHFKLIPINWCDGPSTVVVAPDTCNHACPGNCQLCGSPEPSYITYTPEILVHSLCQNDNSTYSLTVSFGSNIEYLRPNPSPVFYFFLTTDGWFRNRFTRTIKTKKMPVTLHNLTLEEGTTFIIIQQYECTCSNYKTVSFAMSSPVRACGESDVPIQTTTSPVMLSQGVSSSSISEKANYPKTTVPFMTSSSTTAAHLPTSIESELYSLETTVSFITSSSTTAAHLPTSIESELHSLASAYALIAVLLGVIILFVVVLVGIVMVVKRRSSSTKPTLPHNNQLSSPVNLINHRTRLLVLYSWGTSEVNQQRILQYLSPLTYYNTNLVYAAKAHVRGDIPQWVERHINESDKVLIVCNRQFSREWRSPGSTHTEGAIINALKVIINGHVNNGTMDKICCKFALVFLKEKHKTLVPSRILHSFKQYMLHEEDAERQNELFRFILDIPLFQFFHQDCEDQLNVVVE